MTKVLLKWQKIIAVVGMSALITSLSGGLATPAYALSAPAPVPADYTAFTHGSEDEGDEDEDGPNPVVFDGEGETSGVGSGTVKLPLVLEYPPIDDIYEDNDDED
jgi:hypothetical protein